MFEAATIIAFACVLARTSAMVFVAPMFSAGPAFSGYKLAIVVSVSLCIYLALGAPPAGDVSMATVVLMLLRELFLGLFLGFLLHVVVLVVRVGGEMIGQEMGFMVARQADPVTGLQVPLITSIYDSLFLLSLFAMNGHHWLMRALTGSFERAPIGRLDFTKDTASLLLEQFTEMFGAGIVFAAPILIVLASITVMMGFLARMSPQLNVMELGFTLRVMLAMSAMALFAPLLEPSFEGLGKSFLSMLERALDVMEV